MSNQQAHKTVTPSPNDLKSLSSKEALRAHGATGSMTYYLVRHAMYAWVVTLLSIVVLAITITVAVLKPERIILIDKTTGVIVNELDTLSSSVRSEAEMAVGGKRFVELFISQNSSTVLEDKFLALNMMEPDLHTHWKKVWFDHNAISDIKKMKTHCNVILDQKKSEIVPAQDGQYMMKAVGQMDCTTIDMAGSDVRPFDFRFTLRGTPRRWSNTTGVKVVRLFDDPFVTKQPEAPVNG